MSSTNNHGAGSIITPEAVVLDFELAGVASRGIAIGIDVFVQVIAALVLVAIAGVVGTGSGIAGIVVGLVGVMCIVIGYPVLMETRNQGRSLGRMVVGTRVVTVEGAPVRFRHAFARALLAIVELLISFGGIAILAALLSKRGQRLGDMAGGTMVIRERASRLDARAQHFRAPLALDQWSRGIDTHALGEDGYRLLRDFLLRSGDMPDGQREELAADIAAFTNQRMPMHPRPEGARNEDYILAVVSAAQRLAQPLAPPLPGAIRLDPPLAGGPSALPPPTAGTGAGVTPAPLGAPIFAPPPPGPPGAPPPASAPPPSAPPPSTPTPTAPNEGGFATPG